MADVSVPPTPLSVSSLFFSLSNRPPRAARRRPPPPALSSPFAAPPDPPDRPPARAPPPQRRRPHCSGGRDTGDWTQGCVRGAATEAARHPGGRADARSPDAPTPGPSALLGPPSSLGVSPGPPAHPLPGPARHSLLPARGSLAGPFARPSSPPSSRDVRLLVRSFARSPPSHSLPYVTPVGNLD